jgi:hypothetical protein
VQRVTLLSATFPPFLALAGCGMPGAPQPPSLNLPARVTDLSAVRAGDQVALTWTMPTKNTDKILLKGNIAVRVCRNQTTDSSCAAVTTLILAPGADGAFVDVLPRNLAAGSPRAITYFIELNNRKGRSVGPSNTTDVLAGEAPPAISDLTAELHRDGVLLKWAPVPPGTPPVAVRLKRKLLTPPLKKSSQGPLSEPAEPPEQNLLVEPGTHAGQALDTHVRFGQTYEYRAQRVIFVPANGQTLELASALSAPVNIDVLNIFPPAAPKGLAAVAAPGENGSAPAVDLSWQPDSSVDLSGYVVYRRDLTSGNVAGAWQRISPAQPVVGPGYRDASVQSGHTYAYVVSAVGQNGRESTRSEEAHETVPTQ